MTLLDIIETYNTRHDYDLDDIGAIFKDIDIDARLDKDVLIGALLDECGAMDAIYTTTSTFKFFSDNFFKKYKWNIEKLLNSLDFEYNPLENRNLSWVKTTDIEQNLDTDETQTEDRAKANTGTQTREDTGTQRRDDTGTQVIDNTGTQVNDYDETETATISAMNSNDYQPDNKKETEGQNTRTDDLKATRTDNLTNTRTDDLTKTRTDNLEETINATNVRDKNEDLTWNEKDTHDEHGTNNMAYQDLIEKERKISQFSVYGWISKKYAKELFLLVY